MDQVLPYVILAGSLAANLFLFLSLKKEIQALCVKQEALARRLQAAEMRDSDLFVESIPAPPRPGFNLNTRVQVMRLWRQGEPPERIATLLGLSCKEVELLIRVREMAAIQPTFAR